MGANTYRRAALRAITVSAGGLLFFCSALHAADVNCSFSANGTMGLSFGTIDPSSGGPVVSSVTAGAVAEVGECKNFTMSVTADNGLNIGPSGSRRMRNAAGTSFIPYALTMPANRPMPGNGRYVPVGITGTITAADYENAMVGSHSDSVIVTVAP
jgi:spore coat protein U-like protein